MPLTVKLPLPPDTVPGVTAVPSPQSIVAEYCDAVVVLSVELNVATCPLNWLPSTALIEPLVPEMMLMSVPVIRSSSENQVVCPGGSGTLKLTVPDVLAALMFVKCEFGPP